MPAISETRESLMQAFPEGHPLAALIRGAGDAEAALQWPASAPARSACLLRIDNGSFIMWLDPSKLSAGAGSGAEPILSQLILYLPAGRYRAEYWKAGTGARAAGQGPCAAETGSGPCLVLTPPGGGPFAVLISRC